MKITKRSIQFVIFTVVVPFTTVSDTHEHIASFTVIHHINMFAMNNATLSMSPTHLEKGVGGMLLFRRSGQSGLGEVGIGSLEWQGSCPSSIVGSAVDIMATNWSDMTNFKEAIVMDGSEHLLIQ